MYSQKVQVLKNSLLLYIIKNRIHKVYFKNEVWRIRKVMKENIFITEFSNDFFENAIKEFEEIRPDINFEKIVTTVKQEIVESKQGIWHCIFSVLLKECVVNICEENTSEQINDFKSKIDNDIYCFYQNSNLLTLDVAQKIMYDLSRLGRHVKYDLEDNSEWDLNQLEEYLDWIHIGRKEYIQPESKANKEGYKELSVDLKQDLNRMKEKYKNSLYQPMVYFPEITDNIIDLENSYIELNLTYIGNEKFRNYLWKVNQKPSDDLLPMLQQIIIKLNTLEIPLQYIWEKMTGINSIYIIGKGINQVLENSDKFKNLKKNEQLRFIKSFIEHKKIIFFYKNNAKLFDKAIAVKKGF